MSFLHKISHYVAHLMSGIYTPDCCEGVLIRLAQAYPQGTLEERIYDCVVGGGWVPEPELGWDLDDWWEAVVRQRREEVKGDLADEYGPSCECCEVAWGPDLHELVPRSSDTSWRQIFLFTRENCALVCPSCHQSGAVYSDEFKEKIRQRRRQVKCPR